MIKDGELKEHKTTCDFCARPSTTSLGRHLYCDSCLPKTEKRASDDESLKNVHDRLTDLHLK
jgi:hypothetical protein